MSSQSDIRAALGRVIEDGTDGLAVYPYVTQNLIVPAVIVFLPTLVSYQEAFGITGGVPPKRYLIPLQVRVSYADPGFANDDLDAWCDAVTIALLENSDLDGDVESVDVVNIDSFGTVTLDATEYLACNINVEVLA